MTRRLPPGLADRPGAHPVDGGVSFAVWAGEAEAVELCVYDDGNRERRHALDRAPSGFWHGFLDGAGVGTRYGYRAHGPWRPQEGLRFEASKLLLDPWARRLDGTLTWCDALFDHRRDERGWARHVADSAPFVPRSVVVGALPPERPPRPRIPWRDTVVCEVNVRGLSMRHPDVPPPLRGTLAALAHPALIAYWRRLGVTTLELMPVQSWVDEEALVRRGLVNYWGYNPIGFLAPMGRLAASRDPLAELVATIDALHAAGLEILLDLVFNHSAEGGARGPTLSLRGLGERTWYRLDPDDPTRHRDTSGCGNTLDLSQPVVRAWFLDALAWWHRDVGADGVRLDLASALARRGDGTPDPEGLVADLRADPRLADVKLVVEPWDAGADGYRLGRYPAPAIEWNDRFRDDVRRWWGGLEAGPARLATRLAGSSDCFPAERGPLASLNYVAAHDGFTLADVVAYARRHTEANGEGGRDGSPHEPSWNGGVEGPSDDPRVVERRLREMSAMLATLFLSQGVPMLQAGDERGRTQHGNNNAYCHDSALGWIDWMPTTGTDRMVEVVALATAIRRRFPQLRRPRFLAGRPAADGRVDVLWLAPEGHPLARSDWHAADRRAFAMWLAGLEGAADLAILFNGTAGPVDFAWPSDRPTVHARCLLDSAEPFAPTREIPTAVPLAVKGPGVVVLAID
jgi:glycogen operon protein